MFNACKDCYGSGKIPAPQRRWYQVWKTIRCDRCEGDGHARPPSRPVKLPMPPPPARRVSSHCKRRCVEFPTGIEKLSLTSEERAVLDNSAELWNAYLALDNRDVDLIAVQSAVHSIQCIIAARVAKRVNPEVWN